MRTLTGLYAITHQAPSALLLEQVEKALAGGARIIQYRDKSEEQSRRMAEARELVKLCHRYQALFIVNDDVELASHVQADGVHLGQSDQSLDHARSKLGQHSIIGISCYNDFTLAQQASAAGADYVAFGAFFPSASKPSALAASPELLRRAKQELNIPVVAIGGITPHNAAPLLDAGADMLAVIQGLFGQTDIQSTAEQFSALFDGTAIESPHLS